MDTTPENSSLTSSATGQSEPVGSGVESSASSLLSLRDITKSFGAVQALRHVDLDIPAGQVTALIGDNGAGKSTLIKTISGIWAPTSGTMYWQGQGVQVHTPRDASHLGIATVYQDLALCDNLDVVQNMYLGRESTRAGLLDEITMELATTQTLKDLAVTSVKSVRQVVGSLSGGQRQAVAVARAVMRESKLVILDEPTAALGVTQTAQVLELIRTLSSKGIAVLLISHNLNDVFSVADRIAVMYLGTLVHHGPIANYDRNSAVEMITTGKSDRVPSSLASSN
jgi:ABC-type sugar transport system ATPase subunit